MNRELIPIPLGQKALGELESPLNTATYARP